MNTTMTKRFAAGTFASLLLATITAPPVSALDYPLSSSAIRDAYFLGSGDPDKRVLYLEKYTKHYPIPKTGAYVALIQFQTPYVLVAQYASQRPNYHAPDAVQDFLGKPAVCRIYIEIYWGYTNVALSPLGPNAAYPIDYTLHLKQNGKEIPIKSKWTESLNSLSSSPVQVGIALNYEYNADDIQSGTATVEVVSPDGKTLAEDFDLDSLR
jgi:hypothetical protein